MLRGCITVLMVAAALAQAQPDSLSGQLVGGLSIPAELTTTVRADISHRGDPVEFRTLEAVLIANGLVMPANAKLKGRVVGAAPRRGDKPSWLVLLVERAEWKKQSVPLHAFIAAQITISSSLNRTDQAVDGTTVTLSPRRAARESGRVAAANGIDISSATRLPQDASDASQPDLAAKPVPLKDLRIVRDKDGIAYLFSSQSDVKLPSGSLFVLQNQAVPGTNKSAAEESPPAPSPPRH